MPALPSSLPAGKGGLSVDNEGGVDGVGTISVPCVHSAPASVHVCSLRDTPAVFENVVESRHHHSNRRVDVQVLVVGSLRGLPVSSYGLSLPSQGPCEGD